MAVLDKPLEITLNKFGRMVVKKMIKRLEKGGPGRSKKGSHFVGALIRNKTLSGKPVVSIDSRNNFTELVLTMDDYAIFIDKGRKSGKRPPLKALEPWMKRKGIPDEKKWIIAKNIGEDGIEGVPFLKIWSTEVKGLTSLLETETSKDLEILLDDIIKNNNK